MKKIALIFSIVLLASPFIAMAAADGGFVPLAPIPGLTDQQPEKNTVDFLNKIYKYLLGFSAVIAVIMIIWGGLQYATTDSIGNKSEGKAKIQQAILGLILVLMPVLVFTIINPDILNLDIKWQPIIGPTAPPGGGANQPLPNPTQQIGFDQVITNGSYLKINILAGAGNPSARADSIVTDCTSVGFTGRKETYQTNQANEPIAFKVTCTKRDGPFPLYAKDTGILDFLTSSDFVSVPGTEATYNTFSTGCASEGGTATRSQSASASAAFNPGSYILTNCSAYSLPPKAPSESYACARVWLTCRP